MNFFLPKNIFSRLFASLLAEDKDKLNLKFFPSALLSQNLIEKDDAVGLIPTFDLITHNDFYVSKNFGISFDESISNSYIYFNQKEILSEEIILAGDVSSNEAILTKILFMELYGVDVDLSFEKTNGSAISKSKVLVGDRNFFEGNLTSAISFTEQIIELISAPYVNFVFASKSETSIKEFSSKYFEKIQTFNPLDSFEEIKNEYSLITRNYITENLQHVIFYFDEQDLEGIKLLLQLPYFHGIIKDMFDLKFI